MHGWLTLAAGVLLLGMPGDTGTPGDAPAVEVTVKGITVDQRTQQPVIILSDQAGKRALPIWIGQGEARVIAMELQGMAAPRPLTHDLLVSIVAGCGARVEKVTIVDLKEDTFFARVTMRDTHDAVFVVDSRPSDAIALALKVKAPIFVTPGVMKIADTFPLAMELPRDQWEGKAGLHCQELTPALAEYFQVDNVPGVLVIEVKKNSRGDAAGVRQGDVIVRAGVAPVSTLDELNAAMQDAESPLPLSIRRGRQVLTITLRP